jgi:selenocysteine lyase/cysteine desulfurase
MTAEAVSRAEAGFATDARRIEYGNQNYLGLWVLRASADFLAGIGLDRIEDRIRALTTRLMEMLEERRIDCLTPRPWAERAGIVSIAVPDPEGTVARLRREGIVASAKDGALRVSVHFYNSEEDLTRLVRALS